LLTPRRDFPVPSEAKQYLAKAEARSEKKQDELTMAIRELTAALKESRLKSAK
jgi:hypothetical protein